MLLASSFGPLPSEKLLLTSSGKALCTCSGPSILTSSGAQNPAVHAAKAHAANAGDGTKAVALMLSAALAECQRQLDALPGDEQRRAWTARLASAACWLTQVVAPSVLAPRLREQAVATAPNTIGAAALRADALRIALTAFGGHLGASASAALAKAIVDVLLPQSCDGEDLLAVARQRATGEDAGGTVTVAIGGARPASSRGMDGRLIFGAPASESMPVAGSDCGVLMLGEDAASPELATSADAQAAGLPAKLDLTANGARRHGRSGQAEYRSATATAVDHVHAERGRWVSALRAHGVRLLLSGAPLSELTSQLCAQAGICAVAGVDASDLLALSKATRRSVLQQWPLVSQMKALLSESAGFVATGCGFDMLSMGGKRFVHLRQSGGGASCLSSLIVRAPSDEVAKEYAMATRRVLACMRVWLEPNECEAARSSSSRNLLFSLPGGGAAELQLEACVRSLIDGVRRGEEVSAPEKVGALKILGAALLTVPHQLHRNAHRASACAAFDGRWPVALRRLRAEHDRSARCTLGLCLSRRPGEGGAGLMEMADAAQCGVLEPLGVKLRAINTMLACLVQILRLETQVVPSKSASRLMRRAKRRPGNSGADEDDSTESASSDDLE